MTSHSLLAAGTIALGLSITASAALAQPYGKGGNYSLAPSARSDSREDHARHMRRMARCDCPMMRGDGGMREQCMGMGGMPHDMPAKPGSPG